MTSPLERMKAAAGAPSSSRMRCASATGSPLIAAPCLDARIDSSVVSGLSSAPEHARSCRCTVDSLAGMGLSSFAPVVRWVVDAAAAGAAP